jgi:acyl-CoA synthetase (AMP-forming)/AMP-acid ligase II
MKQDNVSSIASSIAAVDHRTPFIRGFLKTWAERTPESVAIAAPGRRPLTYRRLRAQVEYVALNATGIGRGDRVAMIFPNGPEMPTSFLGVAAAMTWAPLNPEYRADEFAFYLADLRAKANQFVVDSLARSIAKAQSIPIIELRPAPEQEAGIFTFHGERPGLPVRSHENHGLGTINGSNSPRTAG